MNKYFDVPYFTEDLRCNVTDLAGAHLMIITILIPQFLSSFRGAVPAHEKKNLNTEARVHSEEYAEGR